MSTPLSHLAGSHHTNGEAHTEEAAADPRGTSSSEAAPSTSVPSSTTRPPPPPPPSPPPLPSPTSMPPSRWVMLKQLQGASIHQYQVSPGFGIPPRAPRNGMCGEFMVSASVRAPPAAVLATLLHGSPNTTILGPATLVESLEASTDEQGLGKEVIRMVLEAPGLAGRVCAPREVLVERTLKTEHDIHVVLFSSVDVGSQLTREVAASEGATDLPPSSRSLYQRPVAAHVRGTYAIAPLEGHTLEASSESLICLIIKVDLCGAIGEGSPLRPLCEALGWRDAFLDRILTAPLLVRDEVEQSRFVIKPQTLLNLPGSCPQAAPEEEAPCAPLEPRSPSCTRRGSLRRKPASHGVGSPSATPRPSGGGAASTRHKRGLSLAESLTGVPESPVVRTHAAGEPVPDGVVEVAAGDELAGDKVAEGEEGEEGQEEEMEEEGEEEMEEGEEEGEEEEQWLDVDRIRRLASTEPRFWQEIHAPGKPCPFVVRGKNYLVDRKKIPAGLTAFAFAAIDVVTYTHEYSQHVARFLPSIRENRAPFSFVVNLIIPGTPLLGIVSTFVSEKNPNTLGPPPANPKADNHGWSPFDFVIYKFMNGTTAQRNLMLKLIPHIADGSWVVKNSVGTKPVITGKALKTTYHATEQYMEVDIDVSANSIAATVTGVVRNTTKSLVIDVGFVLEGTQPHELPEVLLGAMRVPWLDLSCAKPLDTSRELPLLPPVNVPHGTWRPRRA